jgi:transcriptional regulator with XRE-family HTH domain
MIGALFSQIETHDAGRNQKLITQFGKHLRKVRTERKLSQEDLANDSDIPINQIGRIERGEINPSLSTLHAIATALQVRLRQLMDF